jgi:Leucine-rich repeat (LRR) protein
MKTKRLFFTVATIAVLAALISCGNCGISGNSISLTLTNTAANIGMVGTGEATIDWGDGKSETVTLSERWVAFPHSYSGSAKYTITVTGESITGFGCSDNQISSVDISNYPALTIFGCYNNEITSLDVSKNAALTELHCHNNRLTSLDLSNNTSLTRMRCFGNQFTADAFNALFRTLHNNDGDKRITIGDREAADDSNRSLAESKGWTVN